MTGCPSAPLLARELAHQMVGQALGDGEQALVARAPVQRDRRLDQVAAQYISWLQASLVYRGSPLTWK